MNFATMILSITPKALGEAMPETPRIPSTKLVLLAPVIYAVINLIVYAVVFGAINMMATSRIHEAWFFIAFALGVTLSAVLTVYATAQLAKHENFQLRSALGHWSDITWLPTLLLWAIIFGTQLLILGPWDSSPGAEPRPGAQAFYFLSAGEASFVGITLVIPLAIIIPLLNSGYFAGMLQPLLNTKLAPIPALIATGLVAAVLQLLSSPFLLIVPIVVIATPFAAAWLRMTTASPASSVLLTIAVWLSVYVTVLYTLTAVPM
ncbi:hypothetical protein [Corynebacterium aquilae]|uniref:Uncharacterized protein n=1 Tax=Corynebacterium aquilae DSM 44791 TaxID=1431546 RepID=A0A1L7CI01_9CORY|nr:hypothetical protein [Corynebacterium aquilae]APT85486.1 hypothetical protein CAQU_10970 [Corynebacterium aquilae DSM 44791]